MSIRAVDADLYYGDSLAPEPSLSASIARTMIARSPAHAAAEHPRLTDQVVRRDSTAMDIGSAIHSLLLQGDDAAVVIDAPDYRTKDAQEQRDRARELGHIPLLTRQWEQVRAATNEIRANLDRLGIDPVPFTEGDAEHVASWQEPNGVHCRARIDWLRHDTSTIDDLKTTGLAGEPEEWARKNLFGNALYGVQAAFYTRGVQTVTGATPEFRFVIAETYPPFGVSVVSLTPAAMELAQAQVDWAVQKWRECLDTGVWPAYPNRVCYADAPPWAEAQWLEREARATA
jgi:hypothetical protein